MDLVSWFPSITVTSLLALTLWLGRNLIATRLTKSVEYEFNTKLESLRAELRSKEAEIAALRGGAMTAMANRQMALDKRRLEAVDQLWSALTALGPAKYVSSLMAVVKFAPAAEHAAKDVKVREMFNVMSAGFDTKTLDVSGAAKARPFVSPMAWALFSAYQAIAMQAAMRLQVIKSGIGAKDLLDTDAVSKLVKTALPHQASYVDQYGEAGYHYLLEELEGRLLKEFQSMLAGAEADKASVGQAAEILKQSNEIMDSAKQKGYTT